MIDNSKKLDELESKMNLLEETLNEIKAAIKEKKGESSDESKLALSEREENLTQAEIEKIHSIMKNFDFEKVHSIMESLGWNWAFSNGTPSVEELKKEAHRLLIDACEEETNIATGGFRAVYERSTVSGEDDFYLGLEFIVEECEGFTKEEDDDWVE